MTVMAAVTLDAEKYCSIRKRELILSTLTLLVPLKSWMSPASEVRAPQKRPSFEPRLPDSSWRAIVTASHYSKLSLSSLNQSTEKALTSPSVNICQFIAAPLLFIVTASHYSKHSIQLVQIDHGGTQVSSRRAFWQQ